MNAKTTNALMQTHMSDEFDAQVFLNDHLPNSYTDKVIEEGKIKDTAGNRKRIRNVRAGRVKDSTILHLLVKVAQQEKLNQEAIINTVYANH